MSNEVKINDLLKTNINVEPVAVIYNITASVVEQAVYSYFEKSGINGIAAVRISARKEGTNPELLAYAFFNKDSADVISNLQNVPQHLKHKLGGNAYRPSEKLVKTLRSVAKGGDLAIKDGFVYARLDIFKCLAIALNCDPRLHRLTINEVLSLKKDNNCIMSVIKSVKYSGGGTSNNDKFSRVIESLER